MRNLTIFIVPIFFLISPQKINPQNVKKSDSKQIEKKAEDKKIDSALIELEKLKIDLLAQEIVEKEDKINKNKGYIYNLEKKNKEAKKVSENSKPKYVVKKKPTKKATEIHLETKVKPEVFVTYLPVMECSEQRNWFSRQFHKDSCREWVITDSIKIEIE